MTAYQQGYDAYHNGYFQDDCPFLDGTLAHWDWQSGWSQADFEEAGVW